MGAIRKEILIGVLVGLLATAAGMFFYLEYVSRFGFEETVTLIKKGDLYGKVITLAAIPNLFVFFVFLKKKQDHRSRGVLIATILIALLTFVLRFI